MRQSIRNNDLEKKAKYLPARFEHFSLYIRCNKYKVENKNKKTHQKIIVNLTISLPYDDSFPGCGSTSSVLLI